MTEDEVWQQIDAVVDPGESYRDSFAKLESLPRGYALFFAFNYVDAGIANSGLSGFHRSSAWPLVLGAVDACREAGATELEQILRECVLHFHQAGRSKLKAALTDDFFDGLDVDAGKSLRQLEDAYYDLDLEREQLRVRLLDCSDLWRPV